MTPNTCQNGQYESNYTISCKLVSRLFTPLCAELGGLLRSLRSGAFLALPASHASSTRPSLVSPTLRVLPGVPNLGGLFQPPRLGAFLALSATQASCTRPPPAYQHSEYFQCNVPNLKLRQEN